MTRVWTAYKKTRLPPKSSILLLSILAVAEAHAQGNNFSASLGAYLSQGNYGSEDPLTFEELPDTEVRALPFSLKYKRQNWSLGLHSAYVFVEGNQNRVFLDDEFEIQSETNTKERSGFSDISLKASYKLPRQFESTSLRLGTKVKLPTSSKKDKLGSGELDYSFFFNTASRQKHNLYFTHFGYQVSGDTDQSNYNNRWFARISMQRILSKHLLVGGSYYFKQASLDNRTHIRKLGLSATWIPHKKTTYSIFSGFGFSDSTADWSMGIQSTYKF